MVNQRKSKAYLAAFLVVTMFITQGYSCNAQQWFSLIGALLPILGRTYLSFYGFSQKGGIDAGDIAKVQDLTTRGQDITNQIGNLVKEYEKNQNASTIVQIDGLVAQLKDDVNGFLGDLGIKNSANFAKYKQFADAILADVVDLVNLIPVVTVPKTSGVTSQVITTVTMRTSLPQARSLEDAFKARLNALPK